MITLGECNKSRERVSANDFSRTGSSYQPTSTGAFVKKCLWCEVKEDEPPNYAVDITGQLSLLMCFKLSSIYRLFKEKHHFRGKPKVQVTKLIILSYLLLHFVIKINFLVMFLLYR